MPSVPLALDLLLRADAEPWNWTVPTLPTLAARLGAAPPVAVDDGLVLPLPDGTPVLAALDREGTPERLSLPVSAPGGYPQVSAVVAARLGPYVTARRGETVTRWWRLRSGRHLSAVVTSGTTPVSGPTLELSRVGIVPPPGARPDVLADAAADLAVRLADAAYVPVEDESLPDLAAALGGRLAWSASVANHRHIALTALPYHLELVTPATTALGLTWYTELRIDVSGSGDVPGSSRTAAYDLCAAAVTRRCGAPTRPGPETCFWHRDNGWVIAVDRSSGVVRVRVRPPAEEPVRPPE